MWYIPSLVLENICIKNMISAKNIYVYDYILVHNNNWTEVCWWGDNQKFTANQDVKTDIIQTQTCQMLTRWGKTNVDHSTNITIKNLCSTHCIFIL